VRRNIALLIPLLALLVVTWGHASLRPLPQDPEIRITPIELPSAQMLSSYLRPF